MRRSMQAMHPELARRRPSAAVLTVVLSLSAGVTLAEPVRYEIDPDHLSIGFLVEHLGYAKTLGRFREARGSYRFDNETGELSDVSVTVETDSVFTDHEQRDEHLRGGDFLATDRFSEMTFSAASARRTGENSYEVEGTLELLGVSRPLTLDATVNKSGEHPIETDVYVMGVSARGTLERSDFGMTYAVDNGWVGDSVELLIEFEARRR